MFWVCAQCIYQICSTCFDRLKPRQNQRCCPFCKTVYPGEPLPSQEDDFPIPFSLMYFLLFEDIERREAEQRGMQRLQDLTGQIVLPWTAPTFQRQRAIEEAPFPSEPERDN